MRVRTLVYMLGAFLGWVVPASAQDSASVVAFRRGQWGALFSIESPFASAGVLRFTSPRAAWTIVAAGNVSGASTSLDSASGRGKSTVSGSNVFLNIGRRMYAIPRGRVVAFSGFGVVASYGRDESNVNANRTKRDSFGTGAFTELGAQVHVTPYLSIGASWSIRANWQYSRSAGVTGANWSLSTGLPGIQGGLYF